ncbi:MAG TPA: endo alpha-1,4 polygalactosaminidase [Pseudonocardiaceae bacterium]|nr:endo alpha-1,4 polygalactosaminidase [Pseudonocardiaceae bacterium]
MSGTRSASGSPTATGTQKGVQPPPPHARFDYQIGQPYPPPAGVRVVTRDRSAAPVPALYNVCYVNAYQTQPEETDWWLGHHPDLLLTDVDGRNVRDPNWNELLLDISTPGKRAALADIVNRWIDGCAHSGFNAVEPDNLDSWTRSAGLLTAAEALTFAKLIIAHAHTDGLAIAQKNGAEIADQGRSAGFDFAVAEQCADYAECQSYTAAYGNEVIVIEYSTSGLATACAEWGKMLSVVRRDLNVTAPGSADYAYQAC